MVRIIDGIVSLSKDGNRCLSCTIALAQGDIALLAGPNGCGKSTVLDVIAGVRVLQGGTISISDMARPVAYAVQDSNSGLLPWRSVLSNVSLPAKLSGTFSPALLERAEYLLSLFGIANRANDFPYRLSGGEKQAVNLIRTLCTPACLALLDEVFGQLHLDLRAAAHHELSTWLAGKTAILVTHSLADLDFPCNRFFTIHSGVLREVGRAAAITLLSNADK